MTPSFIDLSTSVSALYMVGESYGKRLSKLGIITVDDLLHHYPFRYDDFSLISKIAMIQPGETVTIQGTVTSMKNIFTKYGKKIQSAEVADETGKIEAVWFNQPFLAQTIKPGENINLSGKAEFFDRKLTMHSPEYEIIRQSAISNKQIGTVHTGRLVPVYPETYGLSSKWLRSRIAPLLPSIVSRIEDCLPENIRIKNNLLPLKDALLQIHFPDNMSQAQNAKQRLAFDELFFLQLSAQKRKIEWSKETNGLPFKNQSFQKQIQLFWKKLPFELTNAQNRSIKEIFIDLEKSKPMNRLLQGDVGSGKTVVAASAIYLAYLNGYQAAFMAPTEILANQHYQTLKTLLEPLGLKIGLFTSTTNARNARGTRGTRDTRDTFDICIGTHALIADKITFNNLGLIIIDEQHRFGVEQRAKLKSKGKNPHLLTMTATPIPRTIALTLYGDLEMSVIDEMPKGRKIIKTWVVPEEKRNGAYDWIKKQIKENGSQAFIICPFIEESESMATVKAATKEYQHLKEDVFPGLKLSLLHGKMKGKDKDDILDNFRGQKTDILVATPVVEVGIDIPNVTVMVIEAAQRFGLAQLHQLRGRVGRSEKDSYCLLFTDAFGEKTKLRLKAMETHHIGIELAELDLKIRGPGEVFGTRQHGNIELKIANFSDLNLIEISKSAAEEILISDINLSKFPLIKEKITQLTKNQINPD